MTRTILDGPYTSNCKAGVIFTNILLEAFMHVDPKSTKKDSQVICVF